jgi:hypothetical protein
MVAGVMRDRWRYLLRYLHWDRPPPLADLTRLYVPPRYSSADEIVRKFDADPTGLQKFLLVGARGGGKSTELREVARRLSGRAVVASIDLDASGITAASVSAFDLLYLSGLGLLRLLPEVQQDTLYKGLIAAYGDSDIALGKDAREALSGLSSFTDATGKLAVAMGLATVVPALAAGLGMAHMGVRLLGRDRLVSETSPQGRRLQDACRAIARAVRQVHPGQPLCVLIDGLEKMNGGADERFQQVFCHTRLLADAEWTAAVSAPPSTLTATNSAGSLGYVTVPVWGFALDEADALQELLGRRFQTANLDPARHVEPRELMRVVVQSGGLPRYAVQMLRQAVESALGDDSERVVTEHIDKGIRYVAEELARGLNSDDLNVLAYVHQRHELPGNQRAARLFSDGRILVHAPPADSPMPSFAVHPVLESVAARAASRPADGPELEVDDES